jgi:hypothetical protein
VCNKIFLLPIGQCVTELLPINSEAVGNVIECGLSWPIAMSIDLNRYRAALVIGRGDLDAKEGAMADSPPRIAC